MEETRVLTIVFTDIKGFTERTSHSDREAVSRLLNKHEELLLPLVSNYDGTLIKTIGDAFLLSFNSPTNAVLCAIMMQEKLKEFNADLAAAEKIEIRVAINTGEVILKDGDVFGEPVNVASRIEGLTEANEVWFSESTYLAMNRQEVPTSLVGEYRLKGIPEAVRIYRVIRDENDEGYLKTVKNQIEKIKNFIPVKSLPVPSAKKSRSPYFFAAAVLLLLVFLFGRESNVEKNLRLGLESLKKKDFKTSIEFFKNAAHEKQGDERILTMLSNAMEMHVEQKLSMEEKTQENIGELEEFISETTAVFPILKTKMLKSEIDLALAKANLWAMEGNRDEADKLMDFIAGKAEKNGQILFKIGEFYGKYGYNWTRTIKFCHAAAECDPVAYATNPTILAEFTWFLDKVAPEDGYEDVRKFILDHCYDHFSPRLKEALYKEGEDFHTLRWNAYKMLPLKGEKIDETRFFLVDLLTSPGSVNSNELKEVFEYFQKNSSPAFGAELEAKVASFPQKFPLFEKFTFTRDDGPMKIAAGPLFPHLKNYFHELLGADHISTRNNAYIALKMRNEATPEESWVFSARNVNDFRRIQWSSAYYPALTESLDYLLKNEIPLSIKNDEAYAALGKETAKSVQAMIDQDVEAEKNKTDMRFFEEDVRSKAEMEKLVQNFKQAFNNKKK